jgi:uncharacterized membrane protein
MKSFTEFLKVTAIGGLLVLLPLILFYLLFSEIMDLVVLLATPIADLFPKGTFDQFKDSVIVAVILILGVSFLFGLALCSNVMRRYGHRIEKALLGRLPLYNAVKKLSQGLLGAKEEGAFRPAVLSSGDGQREIAYVIEEHGDGSMTILVPWAPASFAGSVKIVNQERIELLGASLDEVSRALSFWGVGLHKVLSKKPGTG